MKIKDCLSFIWLCLALVAATAEAQNVRVRIIVPTIEITRVDAANSTSTNFNSFVMDRNPEADRPNFVINDGEKVDLMFKAQRSTSCQVDNPADNEPAIGITLESNFSIGPEHPWYPAKGKTTTIKFGCVDRDMKTVEATVNISRR